MKFPSLNRFKSPKKAFPTLEELDKSITKFKAKINENIKKSKGDDYTLKSTAKEIFLILPIPFDSVASMIYDNSSGDARERIGHVLSFFKDLQNANATQYNGILAKIEETVSDKELARLDSHSIKKIQDIVYGHIKKNNITEIQIEDNQVQKQQEILESQSVATTPVPPQDENVKFE
ncbi:MAG: hypothetical protein ACREA7_04640, partial [Nitrosotalea sp.]